MPLFDRFSLAGKRLFITGGSRGLGREMALALAEAGADVVATGRDLESLERSRRRRSWLSPGGLDHCRGTWATRHNARRPVTGPSRSTGRSTFSSTMWAGGWSTFRSRISPSQTGQRILDLNLTSTFLCTRIIGGEMVRAGNGGRIINVASISGLAANRGIGGRSYETSKAAVIQFTRSVAADWAPYGVTVNAICPGGFLTEPNLRWSREQPEAIDGFLRAIPMGKFGEPEDLGPLAVYLASDASRYMTGAALVIDGGYTLW